MYRIWLTKDNVHKSIESPDQAAAKQCLLAPNWSCREGDGQAHPTPNEFVPWASAGPEGT